MSGQSPAPKQRPRAHRQNKSGSFNNTASAPAKRTDHQNQHHQFQHQLPHTAIIPQNHLPAVPRSPNMASPPHTPRANNKRRGRKVRPKDVETGNVHIVDEHIESTGPDGGVRIPFARPLDTPTKAYAGPTFHSSPAPNELPVPKAFSKSVPSGLNEYSEGPEDLGLTSESSSQSASPPASEGSPLAFLFRADRAERDRSSSSLNTTTTSRVTDRGSPKSRNFTPLGSPTPTQTTYDSCMFNLDNEGDMSNLTNRSFSPLANRGARPQGRNGSPFQNWKNNTPGPAPSAAFFGNPGQPFADDFNSPFMQPPTSFRLENSSPSIFDVRSQNPRPSNHLEDTSESVDIRRMESDLRRILKLGPSLSAPQTVVN